MTPIEAALKQTADATPRPTLSALELALRMWVRR